jgi:hypothetical protein
VKEAVESNMARRKELDAQGGCNENPSGSEDIVEEDKGGATGMELSEPQWNPILQKKGDGLEFGPTDCK